MARQQLRRPHLLLKHLQGPWDMRAKTMVHTSDPSTSHTIINTS
jgi:hypothetical protein